MSEFKWDKDKHDQSSLEAPIRVAASCQCGNKAFVPVNKLEIVVLADRAVAETIPIAPLCIKCNKVLDLKELLQRVYENERKRSNIRSAPPIEEGS